MSANLLALAERCEAYDPKRSPDNRADELELHRDIVMATGEGSMNPAFEATFPRSIDAALTLLAPKNDWRRLTPISMSVYAASPYNAAAQVRYDGNGATPALQLCAAILKMKAAHETARGRKNARAA